MLIIFTTHAIIFINKNFSEPWRTGYLRFTETFRTKFTGYITGITAGKSALPSILWLFWIVSVFIRFAIALGTSVTPSIMPDESLYFQLSDSLAEKGQVLFRGQPINYLYITYSILLVPLHWLGNSVNIFRAAQFLNAMIMSAAVFPAFYLGRQITKSRTRAFLVAAAALIVPDMVMINHIMSDVLTYPLILITFVFIYKMLENSKKIMYTIAVGALSFLLYTVKPGYIAIGGAVILVLFLLALRERDKSRLFQALITGAAMLTFFFAWRFFLAEILKMDFSLESLYASQTAALSLDSIKKLLCGLLVYSIYIPVAFLLIPVVLPISNFSIFSKQNRQSLIITLTSMAFVVIGTVYIIYISEFTGDPYATRIHLRYIAAFFPVLLAYCLAPEIKQAKFNLTAAVGTLGVLGGFFLIKNFDVYSCRSYPVDAMLLSYYTTDSKFFNGKLLVPLFCLVFFAAISYIYKHGFTKRAESAFLITMAAVFIVNAAFGYNLNEHNMDKRYTADAEEACEMVEGSNVLMVTGDKTIFWQPVIAIDIASRGAVPAVEFDDAVTNLKIGSGMQDFVPRDYWMSVSSNEITAPQKIILTPDLFSTGVLNPAATVEYTTNGLYAIITPPADDSWLHSALSGFDGGWVQNGSRFTLYDKTLLSGGTVVLQIYARAGEGSSTLTYKYNEYSYSCDLTDTLNWYSVEVNIADPSVPLTVYFENSNGNVYIETYLVSNP